MSGALFDHTDPAVAIIGMSGRFPGAENIEQLWTNLCEGVESISRFTDEELDPSVSKNELQHADYVPARGILSDTDRFDAAFFGVSPREAQVMDPQQRLGLQTAWAAMESAGYVPDEYDGLIGVYAGMANNTYYPQRVAGRPDLVARLGEFQTMLANEKDFLATRISYKLGLTGPSVSVYTGCSTSLVAVCQAFHSLLGYQCDLALAGGVTLFVPQKSGYVWREGGIQSKDGHCRPFDRNASGTVFSEGAAMVVLKRLPEAIEDGDQIYAVLRGAAMNNDGAAKQSFAAPSVEGQAAVVSMAHAEAGIEPTSIGYVETHGTATQLGDAVEIEALKLAFGAQPPPGQVALGSIKSNLGHLVSTAGVVGLIKAALIVQRGKIPPTLHFEAAGAELNLTDSPFFVNPKLLDWPGQFSPRRAGVSSFGIGGTNAHVVVEEPPQRAAAPESTRRGHLLLLSARSKSSLERAAENLRDYLGRHPGQDLADVAYTLQSGRKTFRHRRVCVVPDATAAIAALKKPESEQLATESPAELTFAFPGQGAQYRRMGHALYESEPVYRSVIDECAKITAPFLERNLLEVIFGEAQDTGLLDDVVAGPLALIATEYAVARLWQSWGVQPARIIGHSTGELTAACLAGVFSLAELLEAVYRRGTLLRQLPAGQMMAVALSHDQLRTRLAPPLSLAADNGSQQCVVSGPPAAMQQLQQALAAEGVSYLPVDSSRAYHNPLLEEAVSATAEIFTHVQLSPPRTPVLSTVTADWLTDDLATDPSYWANHMCAPVRFREATDVLLAGEPVAILEAGPGCGLTSLVRRSMPRGGASWAMPLMGESADRLAVWNSVWRALGQLWLSGRAIDWKSFHTHESRRRIALPTYAFDRSRHWIDLDDEEGSDERSAELADAAQESTTSTAVDEHNWSEIEDRARQRLTAMSQTRQGK